MLKSSLALISLSTSALFAGTTAKVCPPEPGAPCYSVDESMCQFCLGPEQVNPAVGPITCNGDWNVLIAGLYWQPSQDGMEYAVETDVRIVGDIGDVTTNFRVINNLIDARYKTPNASWNGGFRLGVGYTFALDGWDLFASWTSYCSTSTTHIEQQEEDNTTLIPLWSAFNSLRGFSNFAYDIKTNWKVSLNLIDLELGRDFWTSKYLSIRPHMGLRIAYIDQDYDLNHKGGSWSFFNSEAPVQNNTQPNLNDFVSIKNDYKGVGLRGGLNTNWYLGRGWSIVGDLAISAIYGKFKVKHDEYTRLVQQPFSKTRIVETEEGFKATRYITDLMLGIEWATLFNECRYGFSISLAYEQHLFLNQNQMWRISRLSGLSSAFPNNNGENVYHQRRGDLDTRGWTLNVRFAF